MANNFNRVTFANLGNGSGSISTVYTVPTSKKSVLTGCLICNKTSSNVTIHLQIDTAISGDADVSLLHGMTIYGNSSSEISFGKLVLKHDGTNGDVLKAYANADNALDITVSLLEDVA